MHDNRRARMLLCAASLLCGIGAAVFFSLALTRTYDSAIQHFTLDTPYLWPGVVFCFCGLALSITGGVVCRRIRTCAWDPDHPFAVFAVCCLALDALAVLAFTVPSIPSMTVLAICRTAFLPCAAAFYLIGLFPRLRRGVWHTAFAIAPMGLALLSAFVVNFDANLPLNAPRKTLTMLAWIAAALFFTTETRAVLGRFRAAQFTAYGTLCLTFVTAYAVPALLLALRGDGSPLEAALLCAVDLLVLVRLLTFRERADAEAIYEKEKPDADAENPQPDPAEKEASDAADKTAAADEESSTR